MYSTCKQTSCSLLQKRQLLLWCVSADVIEDQKRQDGRSVAVHSFCGELRETGPGDSKLRRGDIHAVPHLGMQFSTKRTDSRGPAVLPLLAGPLEHQLTQPASQQQMTLLKKTAGSSQNMSRYKLMNTSLFTWTDKITWDSVSISFPLKDPWTWKGKN